MDKRYNLLIENAQFARYCFRLMIYLNELMSVGSSFSILQLANALAGFQTNTGRF